jgi:hypothetical protein
LIWAYKINHPFTRSLKQKIDQVYLRKIDKIKEIYFYMQKIETFLKEVPYIDFPEFDSIYIKEGFGVGISGFAAM